ncbi:Ankyrin repeat and MYND domain-containing protein 2 [Geodia barretti]|nr:Ankyrin repeat and MYND domain-containing protein 2 [Geodia barretti]
MVRVLVQANVDVNQMDQGGLSPLMMCCVQGDSEMTKLLLDSQANPNLQQSNTGYTALMFACKGGHLDTVMILMGHVADPLIRNSSGITASDVALVNDFPDLCAVIKLMEPKTTSDIAEHPDTSLMKETVDEVVKRFHAQMDHVPSLSLYDSDKGVAFRAPKEHLKHQFSEHET